MRHWPRRGCGTSAAACRGYHSAHRRLCWPLLALREVIAISICAAAARNKYADRYNVVLHAASWTNAVTGYRICLSGRRAAGPRLTAQEIDFARKMPPRRNSLVSVYCEYLSGKEEKRERGGEGRKRERGGKVGARELRRRFSPWIIKTYRSAGNRPAVNDSH